MRMCILSFYFVSCVLCDFIFFIDHESEIKIYHDDDYFVPIVCSLCFLSCFWLKVKVSVPLPFTDCCHSSSF